MVAGKKTLSLTRGSVVLTASRIVTVGLAYALNVFLARELGPELFGLLAVVITVLAWFELFVAEALPLWVVRVIDPSGDEALIPRSYLIAQLALAVMLGAALIIAAPLLARVFGQPEDTALFRIAALDLPLFALFVLLQGVTLGAGAYVTRAATEVGYSLTKLIGTVVLVGSGLAVLGAVLGSIAASAAGAVFALALVAWRFRGRKLVASGSARPSSARQGALMGSAVPAVLVLSQSLALSADLWIVKAMLPAADAGVYRAAGLFAHVPITLSSGIIWGLYAAYSDAHRREDTARMRHYVRQTTRLLVAAGGIWIAVVLPTAASLLSVVFSARYAIGAPVLAILSVGTGVGMLGIAMAPLLLVEGKTRGVLAGVLVLLGVEIASALLMAPQFGATGVAFAVASVHIIGTVWAFSAMRWRLSLPLAGLLARSLLPAVAVALLAWAVRPGADAWLVAWYALFAIVYAALLFVSGAITKDDIEAIREGLH